MQIAFTFAKFLQTNPNVCHEGVSLKFNFEILLHPRVLSPAFDSCSFFEIRTYKEGSLKQISFAIANYYEPV